MKAVAAKLGTGAAETVRTWVRRAQADTGRRPRVTVEEAAEIKRLTAETAELRRTDEILNRRLRTAVGDIPPPRARDQPERVVEMLVTASRRGR
ncbi:hypothetical protein [Streptomyces sp. NPDC093992]|uniref:hypothetical protein n=1 Tax=Streptomyces sp. NPDC093992 TaxID=3366053 RepID=UPI0038336BFC